MAVRITKPDVNLRSIFSELERPIGVNGAALMKTETPQEAFSLIGAGRKNIVINGDMRISQRGTSFSGSNSYTLDRFAVYNTGSVAYTVTQSTDVPNNNFQNSFKLDITSTDTSLAALDNLHIAHVIEGYNARDLIGQPFTLSFWVKSTKTGTYSVSFRNSGPNRSYLSEYTINAANTWEYKTITVSSGLITDGTWNWTNGIGVSILFGLSSGSTYQTSSKNIWITGNFIATTNQVNFSDDINNDFFITGIQLEKGKFATPFEYRNFGEELALCQRYFWYAGSGLSYWTGRPTSGPTWKTQAINFPVSMRSTPTVIEQVLSNTSPTTGWAAGYYPSNGNGVAYSWNGSNWAQWFTTNGALLTFQNVSANSATGASAPSGTVATGDELQIINLSFSSEL